MSLPTTRSALGHLPGTAARSCGPKWHRSTCGRTGSSCFPGTARLSFDLAVHRKRLLITGVPDRSPSQLPAQYRRLLDELSAKPAEIGGFTPEQASDVERMLPRYENRCAELAASPVPGSIQHMTCTPTTSAGQAM